MSTIFCAMLFSFFLVCAEATVAIFSFLFGLLIQTQTHTWCLYCNPVTGTSLCLGLMIYIKDKHQKEKIEGERDKFFRVLLLRVKRGPTFYKFLLSAYHFALLHVPLEHKQNPLSSLQEYSSKLSFFNLFLIIIIIAHLKYNYFSSFYVLQEGPTTFLKPNVYFIN